jgi:hypothetical protein
VKSLGSSTADRCGGTRSFPQNSETFFPPPIARRNGGNAYRSLRRHYAVSAPDASTGGEGGITCLIRLDRVSAC